jgi:SAM-dependent methyltransferase
MNSVFGREYSDVYDALYSTKEYESEAVLVERLLARNGAPLPCRVLDIGCGTGKHALALAMRGHHVTGLDRSPFMLAHARTSAASHLATGESVPQFVEADARAFALGRRFDAALMMFTVLGYQHEEADLSAALGCVRAHLNPGGLFVFDVWNGLAVIAQGAQPRSVSVRQGPARLNRSSSTRVDKERRLCHVAFEIVRTSASGEISKWAETHTLRYFVPDELESALGARGLQLVELRSLPHAETPPDDGTWNMVGVARAR